MEWLKHWAEDIDYLASELPQRHVNLFHHLSEMNFQSQIGHLKACLSDCDEAMLITRLMAIIASVGDAHTAMIPPVNNYLPFDCYWFDEGLHVVEALPEYQSLLGAKIIAVEQQPIMDVIQQLTSIISHENPSFVYAQLPYFFAAADLMYGIEVCDHTDFIQMTLQQADGTRADLNVSTISKIDRSAKMVSLRPETLNLDLNSRSIVPLYRQHLDQSIWFTPVDPVTLYVQYNSCREPSGKPISEVFDALLQQISVNQPQKVIMDLRNNLGGDSTLLDPLIDELAFQQVHLFVIIGRNTFSSALLNAFALKSKAGATIVGEPSGGKPNCYGEVKYLALPNSHLRVRFSTKYYHLVEDDTLLSLMPDIICPVKFADYRTGFDPCLAAIQNLT